MPTCCQDQAKMIAASAVCESPSQALVSSSNPTSSSSSFSKPQRGW